MAFYSIYSLWFIEPQNRGDLQVLMSSLSKVLLNCNNLLLGQKVGIIDVNAKAIKWREGY